MKFPVTPELATLLKTLRVQGGISSKDFAEYLGKSPSYVSKLEGCGVRRVDEEDLKGALLFLCGTEDLYGVALPAAYQALRAIADPEGLIGQLWLLQLDVAERPVAVPRGMADDLADNFEELGATAADVAAYLNENRDSDLSDAFPANQMVSIDYEGSPRLMARVHVEPRQIETVFSASTVTYFLLYNAVHAMFRMRTYPDAAEKLPPDDAAGLLRCTATYLGRWDIHSLTGFSHLLSSDAFISHQTPLAAGEPDIVSRIAERLSEVVRHDSLGAIAQLNAFLETLEWDPAFALKVAGIPFSDLGEVSYSAKKRLLERMEGLVDEIERMDDVEKRIERY